MQSCDAATKNSVQSCDQRTHNSAKVRLEFGSKCKVATQQPRIPCKVLTKTHNSAKVRVKFGSEMATVFLRSPQQKGLCNSCSRWHSDPGVRWRSFGPQSGLYGPWLRCWMLAWNYRVVPVRGLDVLTSWVEVARVSDPGAGSKQFFGKSMQNIPRNFMTGKGLLHPKVNLN